MVTPMHESGIGLWYSANHRRVSRGTRAAVRLIQRLCLDPVHGPLGLELMAGAVIPCVGRLIAARARMDLAHHGAIGLFGRPYLDRAAIGTTDRFGCLHRNRPPPSLASQIIVCAQVIESPAAATFRSAANAYRRVPNSEVGMSPIHPHSRQFPGRVEGNSESELQKPFVRVLTQRDHSSEQRPYDLYVVGQEIEEVLRFDHQHTRVGGRNSIA